MKIIAVTQRVDRIEQYQETRDALDQRWANFFSSCDILPILLPNSINTAKAILKIINVDGFLLTGGNSTTERDQVEEFIIEHAIEHAIPLLGVCKGMQMIQKYFKIPLERIQNHVQPKQTIFINNKETIVNSYHDWGTTQTIPEIHVFAKATDGIIKAIQHGTLPLMGIMWHPERLAPFHQRDIQLVNRFFNKGIMTA